MRRMPQSTADWSRFIENELRRQHPSLTSSPMETDFQNKDFSRGYAVGSVHVKDDDDQDLMYIPFVIEDHEMHPLDSFFKNDDSDSHYLTERRIRRALFKSKQFSRLAPDDVRGAMHDQGSVSWSPYGDASGLLDGFNKHASQLKFGSVRLTPYGEMHDPNPNPSRDWGSRFNVFGATDNALMSPPEMLEQAIKQASAERFGHFFRSSDDTQAHLYYAQIQANGCDLPMRKIAAASDHAEPYKLMRSAWNQPKYAMETCRIRKVGPGKYDAWCSYAAPVEHRLVKYAGLGIGSAKALLSEVTDNPNDELQNVEKSGERIISNIRPEDKSSSLVEDLIPEQWQQLDKEHSKVNVFSPVLNASMKGFAIGDVRKFAGGSGGKIFLQSSGKYAYQPTMAVEHIGGTQLKDAPIHQLNEDKMKTGIKGTFLFPDRENEDNVFAMEPFEIVGKEQGRYSRPSFRVLTEAGVEYTLLMDSYVQQPTLRKSSKSSATTDPNVTIGNTGMTIGSSAKRNVWVPDSLRDKENLVAIPQGAVFIKLGDKVELARTTKEAKYQKVFRGGKTNPTKVRKVNDSSYQVKNAFLHPNQYRNEWGVDSDRCSEIEAFHILLANGSEAVDAERCIKLAGRLGHSTIHLEERAWDDSLSTKYANEKLQYIEDAVAEIWEELEGFDAVKTASFIPEPATVANVLSLRILGPENVQYFVQHLPIMEKTLSFLCAMILKSRLDSSLGIEESEVAAAMDYLDKVIIQIENMKATLLPN